MLLAKIKEKLFNRRNKVEIEDVEVNGEIPASIKALIESISSLKYGYYYYAFDGRNDKLVYAGQQGELIPEDYNGIAYEFLDDGLYISIFDNGEEIKSLWLNPEGIEVSDANGSVVVNNAGIDKINAGIGTPVTVYGEDDNGNLVKGTVSGGTKLYKHTITFTAGDTLTIISTVSSPFTVLDTDCLSNAMSGYAKSTDYGEGVLLGIDDVSYSFFDQTDTLIIQTIQFSSIGAKTDTVTPL